MAKKGGVQQLQADLSTDEDFEKFLERPGLLVLDVYSEWCGPCLGMVGSLRKIKLEIGGDNLQLAICKSDTISYLKRFQRKSEPTWLFVTNGKAVNLLFGTNVPRLMKLIVSELDALHGKKERPRYEITELQPEEVRRKKIKEDALNEQLGKETAEKAKKRREYLNYVTDTIMENLPDIGVTLFGPQVSRDMFKKINEPADALKIQCKDRKVVPVVKENFEIINYACKNVLPPDIIEQLDTRELLVCFWKIPEDSKFTVAEMMQHYAHELTKPRVEYDELADEEKQIPPILEPMEVSIEVELRDDEDYTPEEYAAMAAAEEALKASKVAKLRKTFDPSGLEVEGESEDEEEEEGAVPDMLDLGLGFNLGMSFDLDKDDEASEKPSEEVVVVEEPPKKRFRTKTITIPPIWVPNNNRTHAALIYVFFRGQTGPFLPPDPVPEPPHVVMAFDAYKKKDLMELVARHKQDVPLYGFFTTDDAGTAKFLANNIQKYSMQTHSPTDKIVFKIHKETSHTMLAFATYGPSYVSPNTVIGREEALKFFPENYSSMQTEQVREQEREEVHDKKKRKKSKAAGKHGLHDTSSAHSLKIAAAGEHQAEAPAASGEAPTTSGEESGESRPATAEEAGQRVEGEGAPPHAEGEGAPPTTGGEGAPATEGGAPPTEGGAPAAESGAPAADGAAPPPAE